MPEQPRGRRTLLFWGIAIVITLLSAAYQRITGPSYPYSGSAEIGGRALHYTLARSQGGASDFPVAVIVPDTAVHGEVEWKRFPTDEPWNSTVMSVHADSLTAMLPHQPPAGKLEYRVKLTRNGSVAYLPGEGTVVVRFKSDVPLALLLPHILAMFGAMLLSTRAGLELFNASPRLKPLVLWTLGFLLVGGLMLGPAVQRYAFGAYWTGWPMGTDLTDNKTLLVFLGWAGVLLSLPRSRYAARYALAAAILLLVVYMIPHSVLGSQLDYAQVDAGKATAPVGP